MKIIEENDKVIFKVDRCPYEVGHVMFKKATIELKPGLTVLVGCNGYGKTTFLKLCQSIIKNADLKCVEFDNLRSGGKTGMGDALLYGDYSLAASMIMGSEGEGIFSMFQRKAGQIGRYVRGVDQKNLFVLIDAIDGLSINAILELKQYLFDVAIKDAESKGKTLHFIVASNDYEMSCCGNCLDVYKMQYTSFKDYEDYKKFILKTVEIKRKREERENGRN